MKNFVWIFGVTFLTSALVNAQSVDLAQVYQQTAQAQAQARAEAQQQAEAQAAAAAAQQAKVDADAKLSQRYWDALKTVGVGPEDIVQSQNTGVTKTKMPAIPKQNG